MHDLFPSLPLLIAFVVASFVLAVTPGPGVFYIVTRSLAQGRTSGLASVGGVALGNFCNAVGAAVGLAAVFAVSAAAFTIVKYAGALYLIYLGIKALRTPPAEIGGGPSCAPALAALGLLSGAAPPPASPCKIFRDGFVVAVLNPKTVVFFAAFLPQFIGPSASMSQSIALGALFVAIAAVTDSLYAITAASIAPLFAPQRNMQRAGRYFVGGAFIGLGLLTATTGGKGLK